MSVRVEDLEHRYGRLETLRGVSAAARAGGITALIGPNAAGKTTLLRCVIGSLRPRRGAALIDGQPSHRMRAKRLASRLAYVPQRSNVAAAFTVREVVELGRYALPAERVRVDEALERLELVDLAERRYPALSVGQQQRVTLARALAQLGEEGHLVLDEPLAGMDLAHVRRTVALLRELAAGGTTVIVAMHDLPLAAAIADEAWLLEDGRLVASGPAGEVMTPERLAPVFGVAFRRVEIEGRATLWPELDGKS